MLHPRHRFTLAGAALLAALVCLAAAAPLLAPWPPDQQDLAHRLEGPTPAHPLGQDDLGRDILSRLLWGGRASLSVGVVVVALSGSIGIALGATAGFAGGGLEIALMSLADVLLSFPGVLLAIALVSILGPGLHHLVLALTGIGWVGYARLARSQTLRLRAIDFVQAARAAGSGPARTLIHHLLPNLLGPIAVQAALGLGGVILAEAGLSFLGLGMPPPASSWGAMLRSGTQNLLDAPHLTLAPGLAILAAVLAANLLGEGLAGIGGRPGLAPAAENLQLRP
jgi:peptide/nickel transport system permease protein